MQKILLCFFLACFLLLCFSQNHRDKDWPAQLKKYQAADKIYSKALALSSSPGNDEKLQLEADSLFRRASEEFDTVAPAAIETKNDSLLFFIKQKTGYIHYYFDSLSFAKNDFLTAISLKKNLPGVPDSFQFIPCLYTGAIYYAQSQFDSALFYYKLAERILGQYKVKLPESQRLYNLTGVIYYETGNYRLARNYFEKAILLTDSSDRSLINNYKINIASLLVKLESFGEAKKIYLDLLPSADYENEIYHNLAIISLKERQYADAISYLRKINYENNKKTVDLYYNFGEAFSGMNEMDSAEFYVQRALAENIKWNGKSKNVQLGLILKYQADELAKQQLFKEATTQYQLAVQQFVTGYNDADPNHNPDEYRGAFSYINLFNTLAAKAAAFEDWYQLEKSQKLLEASLEAYRAAFKLADYVEKTYDSDEARLFIGKIKHNVHSKPIDICLALYDLTRKKSYLEEAYVFDQQNKASILALNIRQQQIRLEAKPGNILLQKEASTRSAITRLSLRAAKITDSSELEAIMNIIRDNEIELSRIREKLKEDPAWKERMSEDQIPPVSELQKKLDHGTALLSYHLSENELLILLVTQSRFEYHKSVINKSFMTTLESFKNALHNTSGNERYNGTATGVRLYEKLISPVYEKLIEIKRLVIIPDDELHYLPFEALQDPNNKYLVERFAVQYQYSTALINHSSKRTKSISTLAFAPFASGGYEDSSGTRLSELTSSGEEIKGLEGKSYLDASATKDNFLQNINRHTIIHLATHASVDNASPSESYIAFYPSNDNYKLYAPEIANLRLDSAQLVILSACETGAGPLIKGEGLMSLSRAFAYAGCPNIITSLWKAEDRTTAYLTRQLHIYLEKNYSKDRALQQAKLDLLANEKIDPRFKSPSYWAHLVFIGEYEGKENPVNWWWIALAFIVGAIIYKLIGKKKSPEP